MIDGSSYANNARSYSPMQSFMHRITACFKHKQCSSQWLVDVYRYLADVYEVYMTLVHNNASSLHSTTHVLHHQRPSSVDLSFPSTSTYSLMDGLHSSPNICWATGLWAEIELEFFKTVVEKIGGVEIQGQSGHLKRRQMLLADNCGSTLEFVIWDEQVLLSNLFSEGSWIALDKPFITRDSDCGLETSGGICLEYGSATRLYCVPYVQHKEQVIVGPSQSLSQLTRPFSMYNCSTSESVLQGVRTSQVLLPCDSQGSLDFSNFPLRLFVVDLRNKMSNFCLYGVVTFLGCACRDSNNIFVMKIQDSTGSMVVKLNFNKHWSAGIIYCGDTVFISGLACSMTAEGRLECLWHESNNTSITNISHLPALLNSACLHQICCLSELSTDIYSTQVCRVLIERVELHHLNIELSHSLCGHFVNEEQNGLLNCSFCLCNCDGDVTPSFSLTLTLVDDSTKLRAYCSGQSAAELLQVFPDEFCTWPEDEQAMYLYTIENEEFVVAICKNIWNNDYREVHNIDPDSMTAWRIARALKCE